MSRKTVNFGAGPAKVFPAVLLKAQKEFLDYQGTGISVTELSHRSSEFAKIAEQVIESVRSLLNVPQDYAVLLMHGGGVGQMASIPLNLCGSAENTVDYIVTGYWSKKASKEAEKYCKVNKIELDSHSLSQNPSILQSKLSPDAKYVYYCDNETIHGIEFPSPPDSGSVPLVCDMTSNLFTRPVDVTKFGCIFAGTQKNVGIASLVIVIVRKTLICPLNITPSILDFKVTIDNNSLQNTPSCFAIYITSLALEFIKSNGGLERMSQLTDEKRSLLYGVIDSSDGFYCNPVSKGYRSRVSIPFRVSGSSGNPELEKKFLQEAEALGMIQLKGHRSVGGIRASLYNAVTLDEVQFLVNFMREFQIRNK